MQILFIDLEAKHSDNIVFSALQQQGHGVRRVTNCAEALACAAAYDVAVLNADVDDACLEHLRQFKQDTGYRLPVLLLTRCDALAPKLEAYAAGCDDYLSKPFAVAELEARLRALAKNLGDQL